ncbi:hypothetical protein LCGC14_1468260 [marine sediment metagenome]|uniref:Radical SAM core domain-containing protein n=1 Tax=marine sediment metagenome TaxID=412755 RepID=A0A0F9LTJ5_9ZZZZ
MKIQTFSIVAGTEACDANCPFCVSKQTPKTGLQSNPNYRNFHTACQFATRCGVTTAMITGKGEPTLFPNQITMYIKMLSDHRFPFIELQTNGKRLWTEDRFTDYLAQWKDEYLAKDKKLFLRAKKIYKAKKAEKEMKELTRKQELMPIINKWKE